MPATWLASEEEKLSDFTLVHRIERRDLRALGAQQPRDAVIPRSISS